MNYVPSKGVTSVCGPFTQLFCSRLFLTLSTFKDQFPLGLADGRGITIPLDQRHTSLCVSMSVSADRRNVLLPFFSTVLQCESACVDQRRPGSRGHIRQRGGGWMTQWFGLMGYLWDNVNLIWGCSSHILMAGNQCIWKGSLSLGRSHRLKRLAI